MLALAGCGGAGPECTTNRDCGGGVCVAGQCQVASLKGCTSDLDCALDERCAEARCVQREVTACTGDEGCPEGERCHVLLGACVDAARPPCGGCAEGRYCDEAKDACVECLEAEHCPSGFTCQEGTCAEDQTGLPSGCSADTECAPPTTICKNTMCVLGCGQVGGERCGAGEVCDTNTGRCVSIQGPCTGDAQCSAPRTVCESGQCVPGCEQPGGLQCSGSQACNPSTGRCGPAAEPCVSDAACQPPQTICDLGSGACEPGCASAGCAAPATCDMSTGHCRMPVPCAPDRFEPNDTRMTAAAINGGQQSGLTLCPGDEDWFAVSLGAGDEVVVTVAFVHGEGDIDLELYGPSGTVLASSRGVGNTETVRHTATAPGVYAARVYLASDLGPNPGNTYSLEIQTTMAPCPSDVFEPNDTDTAARPLTAGTYPNLNVCLGNEDFYAVQLAAGDVITVDLSFSHAEGDIEISLRGPSGTVLASGATSTDNERITWTAATSGTYVIRVWLYADAGSVPGNTYSMQIAITSPPPPMCVPDRFEPNDTAPAATSLSPGSQPNLTACGDDDWYAYNLRLGDQLTVNLTFSHAEGDVDVLLQNPAGVEVARASSASDNETLTHTVANAGVHRLRVYLFRDTGTQPGNGYAMNVSAVASCFTDRFEPNNTQATARALTAGAYSDLAACPGDDDFYALSLTAGVPVSVNLAFSHVEGDIDMVLLDAAGNIVRSSAGITDTESISYTPSVSGTFTVGVYLYRDTGSFPGNTYQLGIQ